MLLKYTFSLLFMLCICHLSAANIDDADSLVDEAFTAIEQTDNDTTNCVKAAVLLLKSLPTYVALEKEEQLHAVRSYVFYCSKKINDTNIEQYCSKLSNSEQKESRTLLAALKDMCNTAMTSEEAERAFQFADDFASNNSDAYLKIHMRYLEISERAIETNAAVAIKANRSSSEALQEWVKTHKPKGPVSPFSKPKRVKDLFGADTGFPVPDKSAFKKISRDIEGKYVAGFKGAQPHIFCKELFKIAKESIDLPEYAYVTTVLAAELACSKKVENLSLVMDCLDFLENKFAIADIDELRDDILTSGRSDSGKAALTLLENPDDEKANTTAGISYCLVGNNWKDGLVLLQKCDNDDLKRIASMEAQNPSKANEQKQLGDAWFDLSSESKLKKYREYIVKRSAHWYGKALGDLKGISRDQVEKRLLIAGRGLAVEGLESYPPAKIKTHAIPKDADWASIRGFVFPVQANKAENVTGVFLLPGQRIRVLPNVSQRMTVKGHDGGYKGSGWYTTGDPTKSSFGEIKVKVGDGPLKKLTETIEGYGKVYLIVYQGGIGPCAGSIDCKLVRVP